MIRSLALGLVWTVVWALACGQGQPVAPTPSDGAEATAVEVADHDLAYYCSALTDSDNQYYGTSQRPRLVRKLDNPHYQTPERYVDVRLSLAWDMLRFGETAEAVEVLEGMLAADGPDGIDEARRVEIMEAVAVTYLKMGELDNCIRPDGALICTLPLDRGYVHTNTNGSQRAIEYLQRLLEIKPEDIKYRWLLNIAHMTLGTYPGEVPAEHLVPPEVLEPEYDLGRFDNVAVETGLYTLDLAGGSIIEDFDNDGLLDIMTSTMDPCKPVRYFHNDGNGVFSDHTVRAGLAGQLGGLGMVQADYNNDGWMDVLVMRGGWLGADGRMRMSLLENNGEGENNGGVAFTDVTRRSGLGSTEYPSQSASWGDYDNDGDLDLYSCNESITHGRIGVERVTFPGQLFRNNGDGTFTDVAPEAGVTNARYCKGSTWGDYDNDGDLDLYLSNAGDHNRLYRNDGQGRFEDVAWDLGVTDPEYSFPTWFWDYDNDGWLDLFVSGYRGGVADVASDFLGLPTDGARHRVYRNDGAGGFVDVSDEMGISRVHLPMGANFGDLDNDGFQDMYLGTGNPSFETVLPNAMFRNDAGRRFQDVTFSGGFGHLQKGHGIAFGDLDRDGDQDIFAQMGGAYPADAFSNALFENPGHGNRWLSVRLVGVRSNRAALGARIRVELAEGGERREVHAVVGSGGSFGASSIEQEIGLGKADRIVSLEVWWPASGTVQTFDDVPLDAHVEVREDSDRFTLRDMPTFSFDRLRTSQ